MPHDAQPYDPEPSRSPLDDGEDRGQQTSVIVRHSLKTAPTREPLDEPSATTADGIAASVGHFKVLETIGRGGFGVVVKAFDLKLQRVVAIKMMSAEMAATSPARKRFVREARAGAAVRHENVVRIYAVEEEPVPHLVMEYVPGGSLQQLLDRTGPLDPREVVRIGAQIARGLAAAHATGLVHRDIKPANVMLENGEHAQVKLTDFGLARAADDASLSQSGMVVGTPMYMSPEQARGEAFDHRADLYSLGSVMYVMVSGRPPFRAPNSLAVLARVAVETPRPIQAIIPETPQWLCDIIAKLHAKNPNDRFQSAEAIAEVLEGCLADLRAGALVTPPSFTVPVQPRPQPKRWRRSTAAGLLVCAAIAGAAAALWPSKPTGVVAIPDATQPTAKAPVVKTGVDFTNALGIEFVKVPAGTAKLSGPVTAEERRKVTIAYDYYIGKYEVTRAEWEAVMGPGTAHSVFTRTGAQKAQVADIAEEELRRFPVDGVSWNEAQEFLSRLNRKASDTGWVYRLPTSFEWEYACRNGSTQRPEEVGCDFFANEVSPFLPANRANVFATGLKRPCQVGLFPPNRLGIHDLHGNVFEWLDNVGPDDPESRVMVGGYWLDHATFARASVRNWGPAGSPLPGSGVRLVRVTTEHAATTRHLLATTSVELRRLNPEFKTPARPTIVDDRIVGLNLPAGDLTDISPIARLRHLERIEAWYCRVSDLSPLKGLPLREIEINNNSVLRDLTPLKGMKLEVLEVWGFQGDDLSPLKGMPLRTLNCGGGGAKLDLSPLKGMPLKVLCLNVTQVTDLSPLQDAPLEALHIQQTQVSDLSPLKGMKLRKLGTFGAPVTDFSVIEGMPLEEITLDFQADRHTELLRSLPKLKLINGKPAAEFWKDVEKK